MSYLTPLGIALTALRTRGVTRVLAQLADAASNTELNCPTDAIRLGGTNPPIPGQIRRDYGLVL